MNTILLNTVSLDGGTIIKKGSGGGGVTIKNQEKSVDITENGVTEVAPDSGFTGLSKVVVNTNVASSGGGSDMPVIGDGKTYLYIKIAAEGRMTVPLYINQTVANGVTIDWGDGSAPQTLSGTGNVNTAHTYAEIGDYVISLDPADGCTLGFGHGTAYYCIMGSVNNNGRVFCNMLQAVEIGKNVTFVNHYAFYYCCSLASIVLPNSVTSIGSHAFRECYSLVSIVIPDSVTSIGQYAFNKCYSLASIVIPQGVKSIEQYTFSSCHSLASIVIPQGVKSIEQYTFSSCHSLASIVIPDSVTSIGTEPFGSCYSLASIVIPQGVKSIGKSSFHSCIGMAFYDFSQATAVPTLSGTNALSNIPSDCKIIVPDALYDEWIAATNWSTYANNIIKKSDWDASQS